MTDLQSITQSLRAAVDGGDLGLIADAISALERFEAPEPGLSYQRRQLEPEETSLPNQFSITLVVNRKKYEATWYDAGHDTEGGCWEIPAIAHAWAWRTLDEFVEHVLRSDGHAGDEDVPENGRSSFRWFVGTVEACRHTVLFRYDLNGRDLTVELKSALEEAAESRAREMLSEDYQAGELCYGFEGNDIRGWWEIL